MAHSIFYKILKRRNRASKRAISETIATVVLIAITVVIGGAAWAWANSASANSQHNLGQSASNDIHAVSERFQIVAVNFTYVPSTNTTAKNATLWIFNSGIYNSNITSLLVNNTPYSNGKNGWFLPVGALTKVSVKLTTSITKGTFVTIKANGAFGSYATYQIVA